MLKRRYQAYYYEHYTNRFFDFYVLIFVVPSIKTIGFYRPKNNSPRESRENLKFTNKIPRGK